VIMISVPLVGTLRVLRALGSWSHRFTYARFVVEDTLGMPYRGQLAAKRTTREDGFRFDPREGTADREVFGPFHEVETRSLLSEILAAQCHGGAFVDVGAHVGSMSIPFSTHFDRVLAIEPLPTNCRALQKNILLNGLESKIRVINAAAGVGPSSAVLHVRGDEQSSLVMNESASESISVQLRTVDELVSETGISAANVRLLKVDVEGAEMDVLKGASNLLCAGSPLVVVEAITPTARKRLQHHLVGLGYRLIRVTDRRNLCWLR